MKFFHQFAALFIVSCLFVGCASKDKKMAEDAADSATETAKEEGKNAEESAKAEGKEMMEKGSDSAAAASATAKATCTLGKDVRTISNVAGESGGCEVVYEKNGESNSVASAQSDLSHCGAVLERIKGRLEGAGFTCE